ncbi:MAG: hypothetical protein U1E81_02330 [Xanthobacteraceae bacterium]
MQIEADEEVSLFCVTRLRGHRSETRLRYLGKPMLKIIIGVSACTLALTNCSVMRSQDISQMSPEEIRLASDEDVCRPLARGNIVEMERVRRGLGDCSKAHRDCVKNGYQPETPLYLQCRAAAAEALAASAPTTKY